MGGRLTNEQLWTTTRPSIEQWLRRRVGQHAAEDIMDESFARLGAGDAYPGQLYLTAVNVLREYRRAEVKQVILTEQASFLTGTAIPGIDMYILALDFDRAFRQLPRVQAEAFALTELRGLTERETADVLGVSQKTINRRCEAARLHLQKELS